MGVLCGEAQRLFIPTAPGSKGASSSQAQALCYANTPSQISCLLHGQTQALPWELSGSRHSTVHLKPPPPNAHIHTRRLLANSMHNSTFFVNGKRVGDGGCWVWVSSRQTLKDVFLSVIFCLILKKKERKYQIVYFVLLKYTWQGFFNYKSMGKFLIFISLQVHVYIEKIGTHILLKKKKCFSFSVSRELEWSIHINRQVDKICIRGQESNAGQTPLT